MTKESIIELVKMEVILEEIPFVLAIIAQESNFNEAADAVL